MSTYLTENMIRERASEESFQRGLNYFHSGALYNLVTQPISNGIQLTAFCRGSSAPFYHLLVELDANGIRSTSCTCAYDWGGDCKHIIALLLAYLDDPEEFTQQEGVADLLSGLEKSELEALVVRLVERNPDLYSELEKQVLAVKATAAKKNLSDPMRGGSVQSAEQAYRKQVQAILRQDRGYPEEVEYNRFPNSWEDDWYEERPSYLGDLNEVLSAAMQLLKKDDAEGALVILRVLLEETIEVYDSEEDYEGEFADFIESLAMPAAEAILSAEIDPQLRNRLQESLEDAIEDFSEEIEADDLYVIPAALEYGWKELTDEVTQSDVYDEDIWYSLDMLQQARLNVLERQGRAEEFLDLAQKADLHRYIHKLLQLGRLEEAVAASATLDNEAEIVSVAEALREREDLDDALALAERKFLEPGEHAVTLAEWLAPLEEARGRIDLALRAYQVVFDHRPNLENYRHIKRLAGTSWENLRPTLIEKVAENHLPGDLINIYLEEKNWDAAIAYVEGNNWDYSQLEKVADAVIEHRPDWVMQVSLKKAEDLIARTQSKLYPDAARWLARAKQVYRNEGRSAEWQAYIAQLRATYARRPALQRAIVGL